MADQRPLANPSNSRDAPPAVARVLGKRPWSEDQAHSRLLLHQQQHDGQLPPALPGSTPGSRPPSLRQHLPRQASLPEVSSRSQQQRAASPAASPGAASPVGNLGAPPRQHSWGPAASPGGTGPSPRALPTGATPKPRAKRGQATDPHSIAERQRRERIAERMKHLQELVPCSSLSADKAAMLDAVIAYVKFMRVQMKMLSFHKPGSAAAVAIADLAAGLSSEDAAALLGAPAVPKEDMLAIERKVAQLLEQDVTAAMQYLQGKGFCLMPLHLKAALREPQAPTLGGQAQGPPARAAEAEGPRLPEQERFLGGVLGGGGDLPPRDWSLLGAYTADAAGLGPGKAGSDTLPQ